MAEATTGPYGWRGIPYYTRVTIVGLVVYALLFEAIGVLFAALGEYFLIVFASIFAIPTIVFAGLAWRFGKWLVLVAGIWALLNVALHAASIASALGHVNSFFDFGIALPLTIALIVATVTAFVGFEKLRRGTATIEGAREVRVLLAAVAVVVVSLMVVSGVLHLTGRETVSAANKEGAVAVNMEKTEFDPTTVRVRAGEAAKLVVKNSDLGIHTFTIEELAVDVSILGRSETLIELPSAAAGSYRYICTVPGHGDMKGTLVVLE